MCLRVGVLLTFPALLPLFSQDYVAVSLWGDGSAAGTTHYTVLLFSIYDAKPLMTFQYVVPVLSPSFP